MKKVIIINSESDEERQRLNYLTFSVVVQPNPRLRALLHELELEAMLEAQEQAEAEEEEAEEERAAAAGVHAVNKKWGWFKSRPEKKRELMSQH